jgi:hypothetical protein
MPPAVVYSPAVVAAVVGTWDTASGIAGLGSWCRVGCRARADGSGVRGVHGRRDLLIPIARPVSTVIWIIFVGLKPPQQTIPLRPVTCIFLAAVPVMRPAEGCGLQPAARTGSSTEKK